MADISPADSSEELLSNSSHLTVSSVSHIHDIMAKFLEDLTKKVSGSSSEQPGDERMEQKWTFLNPFEESDLTLKLNDSIVLHCHVQTLKLCSGYFKEMLESTKNYEGTPRTLRIKESKENMQKVLNHIYHQSEKIDDSNVKILLALAHRYGVKSLLSACDSYYCAKYRQSQQRLIEERQDMMQLVDIYNFENLKVEMNQI